MRRVPGASDLGRGLARRLAPRVIVEDLGRISVRVGPATTPGTSIRRRVLALVALLLTRPDFACTRDQVLEALWPELGPDLAVNSLNQTIYFMRRVFEEDFNDDLSPGYVHHESEVIWLDPSLVSSSSSTCSQMIRRMGSEPSPDQVENLSTSYSGRFALDFEYEDWAASFRDSLHASYLQIVERALAVDLSSGHFDRGIRVARRALEVDATAESVEVSLLRLYRASGAHAAAAEQYAHYASRLREELDVEPPPLESL
jgi:DNA-binding SARP family transcriptional activator